MVRYHQILLAEIEKIKTDLSPLTSTNSLTIITPTWKKWGKRFILLPIHPAIVLLPQPHQ